MKQGLIIEDDKMIRTLCSRILGANGYSVVTKSTPLEAVEYSRENTNTLDFIVSDYSLPEQNGYELVLNLVTEQPEAKVILISGFWEEETLSALSSHGFDYMIKPFYPRDLLAKINGLFGG